MARPRCGVVIVLKRTARAERIGYNFFQGENTMRIKFLTIGIALLVAVGIWQVLAAQDPTVNQKGGPDDASLRKHGDYLVNAAILCGDCHTPQDDGGKPDRTRLLRGTTLPI